MSFANQALAAEYAVQNAASLERKVYPVPEEIDNEIARLKLATMGVEIDRLTEEQAKYLASLGRRHVGELEPERIVRLEGDRVVVLDQRRLPGEEVELECRTSEEVAEAIRTLAVRGAPAIGVAAAYGYALAVAQGEDPGSRRRRPRRPRGRPRSTSPGRSTRCARPPTRPSGRGRSTARRSSAAGRWAATLPS